MSFSFQKINLANKRNLLINLRSLEKIDDDIEGVDNEFENDADSEAPAEGQQNEQKSEFKEFFVDDHLGVQITNIERRLKLVNKNAPTFNDIMMAVDEVLEKIPLSAKKQIKAYESKEYQQEMNFNRYDLLWKNFGANFETIIPKYEFSTETKNKDGEAFEEEGEGEGEVNEEDEEFNPYPNDVHMIKNPNARKPQEPPKESLFDKDDDLTDSPL